MRTIASNFVLTSTSLVASLTSEAVYTGLAYNAAIMVVCGSGATGTLKVQVSLDDGHPNAQTSAERAADVTNWVDLPSATLSLSGSAANLLVQIPDVAFNYFRLVYTSVSGTGTISSARFSFRAP